MIRFWFGRVLNEWRMLGVTVKTKTRYWFIGVSRQHNITLDGKRKPHDVEIMSM